MKTAVHKYLAITENLMKAVTPNAARVEDVAALRLYFSKLYFGLPSKESTDRVREFLKDNYKLDEFEIEACIHLRNGTETKEIAKKLNIRAWAAKQIIHSTCFKFGIVNYRHHSTARCRLAIKLTEIFTHLNYV